MNHNLGNPPNRHWDYDDIKAANQRAGHHFFDRETMQFFMSSVHDIYHLTASIDTRILLITSESYGRYDEEPPRFTVREFFPATGKVNTIGEFMQYKTLYAARDAILDIFQEEQRKDVEHV